MKTLTKEIHIINEGTIQYPILQNGKGWKSTENEKLSVIESGEGKVLFSKIINAIERSSELICLQSFLIQDTEIINALVSAVGRQVKIFVLSSAEARLNETIEEDNDFIRENYIQMLDKKFKNHFVHRTAGNFHCKYILIDPKTNPKGFICTNNFTENGFSINPELGVELNKEQCLEMFKIFVYHFWEFATDEQTNKSEFEKVKPLKKFLFPELKQILITSPNKTTTLNNSLLEAVKNAKESISIATYLIDKNVGLVKELMNKSKQKISVTLFCRFTEWQFKEQLKELLDAGIQIYAHPQLHAKSLVVDSKLGIIFSANLITNGLENGLEVGIKLNATQTAHLSTIHNNWEKDFPLKAIRQAQIKDLNEVQQFKDNKLVKKSIIEDNKEFAPKKVVRASEIFNYFNQKIDAKEQFVKAVKRTLSIEIEELPIGYKNQAKNLKVEDLEINTPKGKKEQIVVINNAFELKDIDLLSKFKDYRIYHI